MDNAIRSDNQCFSVNAADRLAASKEDEGGSAHGAMLESGVRARYNWLE
ncbi:hypothetical protein [Acidithiobacillus thiooxidans]|nr:hypothetical protein [Acidithiobacillus thiooxidans]MBU2740658.1 hypothetical protein [Acidithiobacillus albertensis]